MAISSIKGIPFEAIPIEAGRTDGVQVASGGYADVRVNFSKRFETAPQVIASFYTQSVSGTFGRCAVAVQSVTATGCTLRVFNGDTSARVPNVQWVAIGI